MPNPYVNKVVQRNGTTLIDISDTTAVAADVASGKFFYLATGEKVEGTNSGGGDEPVTPTETLLGQTPYTLTEDANIRLKSTSETTYSTGSVTVADFADRENVTLSNATLTDQGSYWELADTGATNWYESTMQFYITGLTPNTTYTARIGGMSDLETYCGGWWGIWDSTGGEMLAGNQFSNEGTLEFTPTSSSIRVTAAPAGAYFWGRNIKVCHFTNFSIEGETSATFTGSVDLGQLASGTTITSTPSCDVYAVIESSGGGTLSGKICVCLGDSVTGFMAPPTDYPSKLASNTGMTVYNCGFAGCRISDTHPTTAYRYFGLTHIADAIASGDWTDQDTYVSGLEAGTYPQAHLNNLKNANWGNVDYITIFYGANDAINGVPLGDATGTNIQTVLGAFNHSITAIRTAYPNIKILVFAPEYIYFVSDNMGAETKNITVYGTSNTMKFYEWGDAIIQRAGALGVPSVDMYRTLGIDLSNWSTYLKSDGAHPNDAGTTLIAQKFETELYNHFISGGSSATLITKTITENGTYSASDDSADGYSSVTVNVSGGGGGASYDGIEIKTSGTTVTEYACHMSTIPDFALNYIDFTKGVNDGLSQITFPVKPTHVGKRAFFQAKARIDWSGLSDMETADEYALASAYISQADWTGDEVTLPSFVGYTSSHPAQNLFRFDGSSAQTYCPKKYSLPVCEVIPQFLLYGIRASNIDVTIGSVGHAVTESKNQPFGSSSNASGAVVIYTTGTYLDSVKTAVQNGLGSNITLTFKASEATTYGGSSYAAGATILTV